MPRIGVEYPDGVDRTELEQRLVNAITAAVSDLGGRLDVLQLDLAARPDWDQFGPINRVTGEPLWNARTTPPAPKFKELSTVGPAYKVDPVKEQRPVCPDCHAMLHRHTPTLTITQLKRRMRHGS